MLFTYTLMLSCPAYNGGLSVKHEPLANSKILGGPGQTRRILMEESQQETQSNPGLRP